MLDRMFELLNGSGKTDAQLTREIGLSNGLLNQWRTGKGKPSIENIIKLAEYFDVSVDYLIYGKIKSQDGEYHEVIKELRLHPELRRMLDAAKGATTEEIKMFVSIIKAIRQKNNE